jgi:hypothetical protein
LNGNLSTDDKGIKQYEWIKLADVLVEKTRLPGENY